MCKPEQTPYIFKPNRMCKIRIVSSILSLSLSLSLSLKLYYQNKQTIITEHTIVISLVKGDHKIAKMLIVCTQGAYTALVDTR